MPRHSFAQKTKRVMKLVCILGVLLLGLTESFAQVKESGKRLSIGVGVSTSLNGCGELSFEHAISPNWSVSISAGVRIGLPESLTDDETREHHQEFDSRELKTDSSGASHKEAFIFSYWPAGLREGPALSFGAEHLDIYGLDAICAISYRLRIWKRLSADISYSIRCVAPLLYGTGHDGTAGLKLYYRF